MTEEQWIEKVTDNIEQQGILWQCLADMLEVA